MKNLVIILMLFIPFISNGQDDRVYWLHGFGGGEPWQIYEQNLQNSRQLTSFTPNYMATFLDGIENSARTVNGLTVNSPNNIIIGYSQGGIVAREMERTFSDRVGGIVTVASPNQGAFVLNRIRNNQVIPTMDAGYNDLVAGPAADITLNILTLIANRTVRQLADELYAGISTQVLDMMPDVTEPTVIELSRDSEYFNTLNNRNPNIPILNIVCEENDDQGLRIGAAALNAPEEAPLHSFDDGELVRIRNQAASWYKGFKDTYNVLRWTGFLQFAYFNSLKNKYARGENYLKTNYRADYNNIIGASRTETYTTSRYVYQCEGSGSFGRLSLPEVGCDPIYDIDCSSSSADCRLVRETYTATRRINEGSDGLFPLSTQRMNGMANRDVYTAEGVNHLEVGNHREMTRILNQIFSRDGEVFERPE